ncbi:uridine diphosphate glucose pyrophosphatase NUDT22-like [Tubulanus polymorphus]|uniref:uridine diphosphate glucose pyrophosphatase NUDT22-like n=1 Tax=Tubulanus polymorphus TaxID=672921 RepID=UPI003DA542F8
MASFESMSAVRSGDIHSEDLRSGDIHSEDLRSGDIHSKDLRSGDIHSEDLRSGDIHSEDLRSGDIHSEDRRSGDMHSEDLRSGDIHSEDLRSGDIHSEDFRSGDIHSEDFRSGDVHIVLKCPPHKLINISDCCVKLSRNSNRKIISVSKETEIDKQWIDLQKCNSKLFNALKFRLNSVSCENDFVSIELGITCYKDFLCTNLSPSGVQFYNYGVEKFNNRQACFSDAIGVGAFVETIDEFIILLKRSSSCAEAPGVWDRPGGHPEPQECSLSTDQDDLYDIPGEVVITEIFQSVLREVRDEVNIDLEQLNQPLLMGIARNPRNFGKPSAEFYIKCNVTSEEIKHNYQKGTQTEADESTSINFIRIDDIHRLDKLSIWTQLTPAAKAAFYLYTETNVEPLSRTE